MNKHVYGKVAVLMGGKSAERAISLKSGKAVLDTLLHCGVNAHGLDVDEYIFTRLQQESFDRVFIALHGRGGEDGVIQGGLEQMRIPYTGSGVLGSSLAMDKCRAKAIWKQYDLPTPEYMQIDQASDWDLVSEQLGLPLIVKPAHEGSSVGACKVIEKNQLPQAWEAAYQLDESVMAERWIEGNEYTVAVLDDETLPIIEVETTREFYDYTAKYEDPDTRYICPCGLRDSVLNEINRIALAAYEVLDASGWGRVDIMLDGSGKPWLIELNTVPGMTLRSLVPMAAKQAGISFEQLVLRILDTSLEQKAKRHWNNNVYIANG